MEVRKDWGVLISQTGSEVIAISKEIGYLPSLVITNNPKKLSKENEGILRENNVDIRIIAFRPELEDYLLPDLLEKTLITLHGFLRVIPGAFFNYYKGKIYNGHPALLTKYPELKGFNMQEAIVGKQSEYPTIGSVVHEVIPELDAGRIILGIETSNVAVNTDHAYALLRKTSLESWKHFFKTVWKFQ